MADSCTDSCTVFTICSSIMVLCEVASAVYMFCCDNDENDATNKDKIRRVCFGLEVISVIFGLIGTIVVTSLCAGNESAEGNMIGALVMDILACLCGAVMCGIRLWKKRLS